MKFAHIRVSEYFTAKLFHLPVGQISLKKAHIVLVDKCVHFSGCGGGIFHCPPQSHSRLPSPAPARLGILLALWGIATRKRYSIVFTCSPTPSAAAQRLPAVVVQCKIRGAIQKRNSTHEGCCSFSGTSHRKRYHRIFRKIRL